MTHQNTHAARRACLRCLGLSVMLLATAALHAADDATPQVVGNWLTQDGDGIIQISTARDGTVQGKIVGGDNPTELNDKDPDPTRRSLPVLGLTIMQGLRYDGDGKFSGGTIYDPDSGKTYKCTLEIVDKDKLKLRGYIGVSLLGRSQLWTRYLGTSLTLPAKHH